MECRLLMLCVLVCVAAAVNGRPEPEGAAAGAGEPGRRPRDHPAQRHRRKRWQANSFGYNYPPPAVPFLDRQDYEQQDVLNKISRVLEELTAYLRRPQQPQPIYVPYPVPYPVPQYAACAPSGTDQATVPKIPDRFPDLEDSRLNWGILTPEQEAAVDDGNRPLNFNTARAPFAAGAPTTRAPVTRPRQAGRPDVCQAAVLTCCRPADAAAAHAACFASLGCAQQYSPTVCSRTSVNSVIDLLVQTYSPK